MDGCRQFLNKNAQKRELKKSYGGKTDEGLLLVSKVVAELPVDGCLLKTRVESIGKCG